MFETKQAILPGWMRAIIFLPAFLIAYFLGSFVFAGIYSEVTGITGGDVFETLRAENLAWFSLYLLIIFVFVTGCVWLFQNLLTQRPMRDTGLHKKNSGRHIATGILAGFAVNTIMFLTLWIGGYLKVQDTEISLTPLFLSVIVTMLVSLTEEISMRGYLLASLMDSMNKYLALAVSSLVFAMFHLFNPNIGVVGFTNIFLAGCLLGIGYIYNRSLWFPISLHFSWNFFLGPVFGFEVSGLDYKGIFQHSVSGPEWLTGGYFGAEGSLMLTVLLVLLIVAFGKVFREEAEN